MNQRNSNSSVRRESMRNIDAISSNVINLDSVRGIVGEAQTQKLERALTAVPQEIGGVEMAGVTRMFVDEVRKLLANGNDIFSHRIADLMSREIPPASNDDTSEDDTLAQAA